jgi:hydroxyacylglutathione hydrolase
MMFMLVETFTVGMLSTNCYLASCSAAKDALIIDPGLDLVSEAQAIVDYISEAGLIPKCIVNTHGHEDHIKGNVYFQNRYNIPVCIHSLDEHAIAGLGAGSHPPNILLKEGSTIECGQETLAILHTPGHTPGSICLLSERILFSGDTLFARGIGRTDFPGGSGSDMKLSLQRLIELPDYLMVYPGHGETTTIGEEKRINPFLNNKSEDMFLF